MTIGLLSFYKAALMASASGNNQLGLEGLTYFDNSYPFHNWAKKGNGAVLTLNMAGTGAIGSISFGYHPSGLIGGLGSLVRWFSLYPRNLQHRYSNGWNGD